MTFSFRTFYPLFTLVAGLTVLMFSGCDRVEEPEFVSLEPMMGPGKTLVVMKGNNLADIRELLFNDEAIPFNTAYNSDVALLFRIPENISLGQKVVTVRTDGGSFTTDFLVTEEAPIVRTFFPRSANEGDLVTIVGENFFDPIEVTFKTGEFVDGRFTDSLEAEIVFQAVDSMIVRVPEGTKTGFIRVVANGGTQETNVTFQIFEQLLVTDFDGGGLVANDELSLIGFTDQQLNGAPLIRSSLPAPIDGSFMQISGTDDLNTVWLGGPETPGGAAVDSFGIETDVRDTFLEFDVNSNGRTQTFLTLVLNQQDGSFADFFTTIQLNETGWSRVSIPLVRFKDSNGIVVKPSKVNRIKFHIEDRNDTDQRIEANIDNVAFVERI